MSRNWDEWWQIQDLSRPRGFEIIWRIQNLLKQIKLPALRWEQCSNVSLTWQMHVAQQQQCFAAFKVENGYVWQMDPIPSNVITSHHLVSLVSLSKVK